MVEVSGLGETVRGTSGFGSTGMQSGNVNGTDSSGKEKEMNIENERIGVEYTETKKNEKVVEGNVTLNRLNRKCGERTRTEEHKKITTEGSSRMS